MIKLPFTEDPMDSFFVEVSTHLKNQGISLSQEKLYVIYGNVCDHVAHAVERYGAFWVMLTHTDEIDISVPERSFYAIIHRGVGVPLENMAPDTAEKAALLESAKLSIKITAALNHFFNWIVGVLKKTNPALG